MLCQEYAPQSGFAIRYSGVANLPALSEMAGISFFYCLLEALKNVDKHAFASHVDVNLSYNDDYVYLRVKDDGIGFTATTIRDVNEEGIGLVGIKERSESNEGFMKIESEKGQGTTLTVAIPRLDAPEGA
jgi:signal transduction histidine kinase